MRIEHIALWTRNLERSRAFYEAYFEAGSSDKYTNPTKQFESYFMTFGDNTRLELMQMPDIADGDERPRLGWSHIAFATGSMQSVDQLTERLRADGYTISSEPRITGDGYYESVILDPDGNRIEITT